MGEESMKDFILDSKGRCFLCLDTNLHPSQLFPSELVSTYSLQCLSRYLKLDMRKVFHDKWSVPSHLLSALNMCRLKVELCTECGSLNAKFSRLFQQLEKAKMEVTSCLNLIHEKLSKVMGDIETEGLGRSLTDQILNSKDEFGDEIEIEIMEELRTNAIRKCCHKLLDVGPRVKVEKLDIRKYVRSHLKTPVSAGTIIGSSSKNESDLWEVTGEPSIKMENPLESLPHDETDTNNDHLEEFAQDQFNEPSAYEETAMKSNKMECYICHIKVSDLPSHLNTFHFQTDPEVEWQDDGEQRSADPAVEAHRDIEWGHSEIADVGRCEIKMGKGIKKGKKVSKKIRSYIIVRPVNSNLGSARSHCTVNSDTGKQTCNLCSREFLSVTTFKSHYRSVHLQIKYVCKVCGMEFPRGDICLRHHRSYHVPLIESKFKCHNCGKRFIRSDHLTKHERSEACRTRAVGMVSNVTKDQQAAETSSINDIEWKASWGSKYANMGC